MRRTAFFLAPALSILAGVPAFGQEPSKPANPVPSRPAQQAPVPASPCPQIELQSTAARGVREGQTVSFAANIQGGDPKVTPQLIWQVNGGTIKAGQQTKRIEVDTTGAGAYREITADLWIGGYPGECMAQWSATIRVVPPAAKADEFGDLEPDKEKERLAAWAASVAQTDDRLYIIAYAGRTSPRGYAVTALKRMRDQLTADGFDVGRINILDGGFREEAAYEVWVVPNGAVAPRPSPTVDRREIVYPRTAPVRKPRKP